jgi:hypothetical protein
MPGTKLIPEKITSPFQLMAAWFSMLVLLSSVLLTAAAKISEPSWAAGYLVIFTSIVVVLVIACVTLMLTVFRPHLQDGKEYARWLRDKSAYYLTDKSEMIFKRADNFVASEVSGKGIKKSACLVNVVDMLSSSDLVSSLRHQGFNAQIYDERFYSDETNEPEQHEAIWVGSRVSLRDALKVIETSVSHWKHLKYLELSSDDASPPDEIHDEMFIGGSSQTAVARGLREWRAEEIQALLKSKTIASFHRAVRQKYS